MDAYYDLGKSPATHDFVNWLVRAERQRKSQGADTLNVYLVPGARLYSDRDKQYTPEQREWRVQNLLMPLARLVPSVRNVGYGDGLQDLPYGPPGFAAESIFKAPSAARQVVAKLTPPNAVTITLRNSDFEPMRNSRQGEWEKVGDWLQEHGYNPIFIPDMEADMRGKHAPTRFAEYVAASYNFALRLALWESAKLNLMVNGGPMAMALHSDVSALVFKAFVPEVYQCSNKAASARTGYSPHTDWCTAGYTKKVFWEDDTAKNVIPVLAEHLKVSRG